MTFFDTASTNPARADRQELRRRATGVAGIAVRAAALSGVRVTRGGTPAGIPRQRDDADRPGPSTQV